MGRKRKTELLPKREEFYKIPEGDRLKYIAADELGLYDKILASGWSGLTYSEAGKIGGRVTSMKKRGRTTALQNEKKCYNSD